MLVIHAWLWVDTLILRTLLLHVLTSMLLLPAYPQCIAAYRSYMNFCVVSPSLMFYNQTTVKIQNIMGLSIFLLFWKLNFALKPLLHVFKSSPSCVFLSVCTVQSERAVSAVLCYVVHDEAKPLSHCDSLLMLASAAVRYGSWKSKPKLIVGVMKTEYSSCYRPQVHSNENGIGLCGKNIRISQYSLIQFTFQFRLVKQSAIWRVRAWQKTCGKISVQWY